MSSLCIFFAGAFTGAGVTFLSMCFAFCASERKNEGNEEKDDEDI